MQRFGTLVFGLMLLIAGCAPLRPTIERQPAPPVEERATVPGAEARPTAPTGPVFPSVTPATAYPIPPMKPITPRSGLALVLPLNSAAFGRAAEMVRQGFVAAQTVAPEGRRLEVKVYPSEDISESIVSSYQAALQGQPRLIVGPLTRNGVTAVAMNADPEVRTLALNQPEDEAGFPAGMYFFGLSVEAEARQVARLALQSGYRRAALVGTHTSLSKRSQSAFAREWVRQGGQVVAEENVDGSTGSLIALRDRIRRVGPDAIFLATDYTKGRLIRPYLGAGTPIFATSQINSGTNDPARNIDLNEIRFVDMPWMLQPDHPAVMVYPRPQGPLHPDLERLYALGIDAYRLAELLIRPAAQHGTLDGVTGQIRLNAQQVFERELVPAIFREGVAVIDGPVGTP